MAMACSILESTIEQCIDCLVGVCAPAVTFVGKDGQGLQDLTAARDLKGPLDFP
jgi:hypothetical protein